MKNQQNNKKGNHAPMSNNERIINRTNQRKKKNKQKKMIIRLCVGCIFLVVGVVLALTLFFNINKIIISGDKVYSDELVIEASGVKTGDNLIFLSEDAINEKISKELAYVGQVNIRRRLPSTLEIRVTRTDAFMAIASDGYYIVLDRNGKVLEKDLETVDESIILANLGEISKIEVGETIGLKEEKTFKKLNELLDECENAGLHDITLINLSDIYNIKLVYQGRITLELGETDSDNLGSKLALGQAAIERQDEENSLYRGTINLTVDGKGYWSEEVSTTEPVTEETTTQVLSENAERPEDSTSEEAEGEPETTTVSGSQ